MFLTHTFMPLYQITYQILNIYINTKHIINIYIYIYIYIYILCIYIQLYNIYA